MRVKKINDTYYKTQAGALNSVQEFFDNSKYEIVYPDNLWTEHVAYGTGVRYDIPLKVKKTGNLAKKWLHIALYRMDSGNYELTYYIN